MTVHNRLAGCSAHVDAHIEAVGPEPFRQEVFPFVYHGPELSFFLRTGGEIVGAMTIWDDEQEIRAASLVIDVSR